LAATRAATIISKALLNAGDGLIEVRRIDAAKEVAESLARSRGVT
jgi:prohibitin 1